MNTPHDHHDHCDPTDPILQSLADEAADLPAHAASEARLRKMRHLQRRYHAASALTILFVGVCSWMVVTTSEHRPAFVAVPPTARETDPDKPTASVEPSSPIAPTSPNSPTSPFAREAPDNPSPSPTPEIATSKPMPAPRPDGSRAHPAPTAPFAPPDSFKRSATMATEVSGALPRDFVKVQTEEEAMRNPLPLPEGLDPEQQELFKAARGLPLLLVRDSAGKVLRIHVIER